MRGVVVDFGGCNNGCAENDKDQTTAWPSLLFSVRAWRATFHPIKIRAGRLSLHTMRSAFSRSKLWVPIVLNALNTNLGTFLQCWTCIAFIDKTEGEAMIELPTRIGSHWRMLQFGGTCNVRFWNGFFDYISLTALKCHVWEWYLTTTTKSVHRNIYKLKNNHGSMIMVSLNSFVFFTAAWCFWCWLIRLLFVNRQPKTKNGFSLTHHHQTENQSKYVPTPTALRLHTGRYYFHIWSKAIHLEHEYSRSRSNGGNWPRKRSRLFWCGHGGWGCGGKVGTYQDGTLCQWCEWTIWIQILLHCWLWITYSMFNDSINQSLNLSLSLTHLYSVPKLVKIFDNFAPVRPQFSSSAVVVDGVVRIERALTYMLDCKYF